MIVENFPLTSLIKLRLLTNGNFEKKMANAIIETNIPFLPLKLTATWNLVFLTVGTIVNVTTTKSWNVPSPADALNIYC